LRLVGLEPGRSPGATLAEQVPALVEGDLEVGEALGRRFVERRIGMLVAKFVLLVDESVDTGQHLLIVHRHMSSPTPVGRKPS
jgi:hypothetical protein